MVSAVITQDQLGQIGEATNGAQKTAVSAHIAATTTPHERADAERLQRYAYRRRRQRALASVELIVVAPSLHDQGFAVQHWAGGV